VRFVTWREPSSLTGLEAVAFLGGDLVAGEGRHLSREPLSEVIVKKFKYVPL
jgi:hypothetical protein